MSRILDYDGVADRYGRRYALHDYGGVRTAVLNFIGDTPRALVEIGCGSGHWLEAIAGRTSRVAGIDPSRRMLAHARRAAPGAWLVRARATRLPLRDASFDRVLCVNALHHFGDRMQFFLEARRVLAPGGGIMTVGLDPDADRDRWWVYDFFQGTRDLDLGRFAPVRTLRGELARAGFAWVESCEADRIEKRVTVAEALASGVLERTFSSELMMLSDDEYERGLDRIRRADAERAASGGALELVTDLRLYATTAWL